MFPGKPISFSFVASRQFDLESLAVFTQHRSALRPQRTLQSLRDATRQTTSDFRPVGIIFEHLFLFDNVKDENRLSTAELSFCFRVLDEEEMYKEQKYFDLESWSEFSFFLNNFVYRMIRLEFERNSTGKSKLENSSLYKTLHQLLVLLYERNVRKSFSNESLWLIR